MFKRFIRAIKSLFGGFVSSMEDPKLILEQNIRDLNDQIPQMNENIATVKANMLMVQKEVKRNEKAIKVKKAFMKEKDRKIQEAKEALRAHERAEWQAKIADTLEQFEVGGLDQTHDEMVSRINEEAAKNEARMEIALDTIDTEAMEIEANAEKIRAKELVAQFKQEMDGGVSKPEISIDEKKEEAEKDSSKTVGNRQKEQS